MPTDEPDTIAAPSSASAGLRELIRRPADLVDRTRWLFALCSAAGLVFAVP